MLSFGRLVMGRISFFWEDNWVGCGALKSVFPRLYSLSISRNSKTVEFEDWVSVGWVWHVPWRMRLFEWEKPLKSHLLQELQGMKSDMEIEDTWV